MDSIGSKVLSKWTVKKSKKKRESIRWKSRRNLVQNASNCHMTDLGEKLGQL